MTWFLLKAIVFKFIDGSHKEADSENLLWNKMSLAFTLRLHLSYETYFRGGIEPVLLCEPYQQLINELLY